MQKCTATAATMSSLKMKKMSRCGLITPKIVETIMSAYHIRMTLNTTFGFTLKANVQPKSQMTLNLSGYKTRKDVSSSSTARTVLQAFALTLVFGSSMRL